ncbi:MAG: dihydroorotase [Flavobacteriaceae bacterium]
MKILLKNATILDHKSPYHNQKKDFFIQDGQILEIQDRLEIEADTCLNFTNLHISKGWFDPNISFGEPGYEERETLTNGLLTAAKSGFTHILLNPNTAPLIESHADVSHLLQTFGNQTTKLHVGSVLSKGAKGEKMASLFDLHKAGATTFGDYKTAISNPNLLHIALDYIQSFQGIIQAYPLDESLGKNGQMHEGLISTSLGLKGIPKLAETVILARDLQILEYTQGSLHIPFISCAESVELIRSAKKKGLDVTCGVGIPHLIFTDDQLMDFNSAFKILPPLRSHQDQKILRQGLLEGTIDMVTSLHQPINPELKDLEFVRSKEGSIGLEAAFGSLLNHFPLENVLSFLTRGKSRFGIDNHPIDVGTNVDLTLFNPKGSREFTENQIHSTSKNCMYIGSPVKGTVYGCIREKQIEINPT